MRIALCISAILLFGGIVAAGEAADSAASKQSRPAISGTKQAGGALGATIAPPRDAALTAFERQPLDATPATVARNQQEREV